MYNSGAYKGALAVGPPSIFASWGFDLLRDMAAAMEHPLEVRQLDKFDEVGPEAKWPQTLFLSQLPSASVISTIESAHVPVVAFLDDAPDAVAYIRRNSGCTVHEALRLATSGAVANRALWNANTALVFRRQRSGPLYRLIDKIGEHLMLHVSADALKAIKEKYCGSPPESSSLEDSLQRVHLYKPPGAWSKELSPDEAEIVDQVLTPLILMALQEECVPVRWTFKVMLSGDRPNEPAPMVANIAGPTRYIYYGPYFHLPPGAYRAQLVAGFSQSAIGVLFSAEVAGSSGTKVLARARFEPKKKGIFLGEFLLTHTQPQDALESRLVNDEAELDGQVGLAWFEFQYLGNKIPITT